MKNKKYLTVGTVKKYHTVGTVKKYHTVGTVKKYHTVGTVKKYHTVGTVQNSNWKIIETEEKSTPLKCIYTTAHFPDWFWLIFGV